MASTVYGVVTRNICGIEEIRMITTDLEEAKVYAAKMTEEKKWRQLCNVKILSPSTVDGLTAWLDDTTKRMAYDTGNKYVYRNWVKTLTAAIA